MAMWRGDQPVVSVLCPTYQHAPFIEDAIKGVLGQVTDFPFELLIRDDGSSDGTGDIVRDYADSYPQIIKAVIEPHNTWQHTSPGEVLRGMATGEFLAFCEGDDYWIHPGKLARQVGSLRRRDDAMVSFHDVVTVVDGVVDDVGGRRGDRREFKARDARGVLLGVSTLSMCYRREPEFPIDTRPRVPHGDVFLKAWLSRCGSTLREDDLLAAVYRVHPGGVVSGATPGKFLVDTLTSHTLAADYFVGQGDLDIAEDLLALAASAAVDNYVAMGVMPHRQVARSVGVPARIELRLRRRARNISWLREAYRKATWRSP